MQHHLEIAQPQPLFKSVVRQIRQLPWTKLDPGELQRLMQISHVYACEFAEALRIALELYPDHVQLAQMARGELATRNLAFRNYTLRGDHSHFLEYFLRQSDIEADAELRSRSKDYLAACRALDAPTRAMSVFSREAELSDIFREILHAHDWSAPGLDAFRFYLERHIEFDSTDGGHCDLVESFPVDDRLVPFYRARLATYRAIPKLFEQEVESTPALRATCVA